MHLLPPRENVATRTPSRCLALAAFDPTWPTSFVREEDLQAFAQRDWARVERAKLAYWARQYAEHGPAPAMRAAEMLRLHVQAHTGGSMGAQRRQDLAHHIRLKRRIDAASAW